MIEACAAMPSPPVERDVRGRGRRHGLLIVFDPARIEGALSGGCGEADREVGLVLVEHGFLRISPGFYMGEVDVVRSVLAIQDTSDRLAWFKPSLRDARLLRIEEIGDLGIAL